MDRKKDMIIAGGFNIYPREIDEVLFQHPKVQEAVSVGIPDPYRGETVKAYIVLKPGQTATEEEIIAFCKEKLAAYKVPKMIEFRESLPKSAVGKVLRKVLRAEEEEKKKKLRNRPARSFRLKLGRGDAPPMSLMKNEFWDGSCFDRLSMNGSAIVSSASSVRPEPVRG